MAHLAQFQKPSKNLLALGGILSAAVLSNMLTAPKASAVAIFNFSFSNLSGGTTGTVQGTIGLPDGDGTFGANSVIVTSAPASLGYTLPLDIPTNPSVNLISNSFTVSGGTITNSSFSFTTLNLAFILNSTGGSGLATAGTGSFSSGVFDGTDTTLAFSSATPVPLESDALPVVGSALFMAGGLWWKKKRAQAKVADFIAKK